MSAVQSAAAARRRTAEERRDDILEAAMAEFAIGGLHGTSTEAIARRAGISQPYLFKLFGTKKELFRSTVALGFRRTREAFERAVRDTPPGGDLFDAMGAAYVALLADRKLLLGQLQSYAACDDPDVRAAVRGGYGELWRYVAGVSGRPEGDVRRFFATGMLINVMAAMDLTALDEPWARACVGPCCG